MTDTSAPLPRPRSSLLVIGMAGRLGSGASFVRDKILQNLRTFDYAVDIVDVTKLMEHFENQLDGNLLDELKSDLKKDSESLPSEAARRVRRMQLLGNCFRRRYGNEILAALSVSEFISADLKNDSGHSGRKAYVIDSLKHPEEVQLFRKVFGRQFWMIGVVSSDSTRFSRLKQRKGFSDAEFEYLSREDADGIDVRDVDRVLASGQAAVKTVLDSDYFFANDFATKNEIESEAARLTRIIFGVQVVTPTSDEVGMNAAYQASLRSACLSRQVGASVMASTGEILSTGHNDVPKFGGGLYGATTMDRDRRCWAFGAKCYNDEEKLKITEQVVGVLVSTGLLESSDISKAVDELRKSRISGLIEFSRAVHAEMEALLAIARIGVGGLVGSTLYSTTFPCHNCAKHIVDAGVNRVVFLEPYEKSLARVLHSDAINDPLRERDDGKVRIENYGGVSPRRYGEFFMPHGERKSRGRFTDSDRVRHGMSPIFREEAITIEERIAALDAWIFPNQQSGDKSKAVYGDSVE